MTCAIHKFYRAFLVAILVVSLMPLFAYAEEAEGLTEDVPSVESGEDNVDADSPGHIRMLDVRIDSMDNPLSGGTGEVTTQMLPAQTGPSLDSGDQTTYVTQSQASAILAEAMANRQASVAVSLKTDANYASLNSKMFHAAFVEDGNPQHGDYLRWIWTNMRCSMTGYIESATGAYYITYTYQITYKTTAAQENALMDEVDSALASLNLNGKSNYAKTVAIHDYICDNVVYDYGSYDSSYKLQYTAYSAMTKGKAVCQGYASLFYLMAGKAGLSNRIIAGYGNGGDHAWNIVQLDDGKYYNLDATWDSQRARSGLDYAYFLKSNADFAGHVRNTAASGSLLNYNSADFNAAYPMSSVSYVGGTITASNVKLSAASYTYNGAVRTPSVTVTKGGVELEEDVHYTVTYDSGRKRSGTYNVVVKGIGNCTGTVTKSFTIKDAELEESHVTLEYASVAYDGTVKKPDATVKVNGVTQYASEYQVTYWNAAKSGKVSPTNVKSFWVKVEALDDANTSGVAWKKFVINPKSTTITALTAQNNGFKATWTKRTAQLDGYRVSYKLSTADSWTGVNVANYNTNTKTITDLKDSKQYQVRVRLYKVVDGVTYNSAWSPVKTVTTK